MMYDMGVNLCEGGGGDPTPADQDLLLAECVAAGVETVLGISADLVSSERTSALAVRRPDMVWCTVGVHPQYLKGDVGAMTPTTLQARLRALVETTPGCVAIGECGLDCAGTSSSTRPKTRQLRVFEAQVDLAKDLGLPLYLHCRNVFPLFFEILRARGYARGLLHCFTGTLAQAREALDLGLYIGVTGVLLMDGDPRAGDLAAGLQDGTIPLSRVIIETDAPWLSPDPARPSHPRDVWAIAKKVAALCGDSVSLESVREASCANARALFQRKGGSGCVIYGCS